VRFLTALLLALLTAAGETAAADRITAQQAASHIGETIAVCGTVVSANYAVRSKGQPTYLNFDQPYPNQIFTVVIWGSERSKFGEPENTLLNKRICATGTIKSYRGKPEIIATNPSQIATQ
jgi:hypothetical protein